MMHYLASRLEWSSSLSSWDHLSGDKQRKSHPVRYSNRSDWSPRETSPRLLMQMTCLRATHHHSCSIEKQIDSMGGALPFYLAVSHEIFVSPSCDSVPWKNTNRNWFFFYNTSIQFLWQTYSSNDDDHWSCQPVITSAFTIRPIVAFLTNRKKLRADERKREREKKSERHCWGIVCFFFFFFSPFLFLLILRPFSLSSSSPSLHHHPSFLTSIIRLFIKQIKKTTHEWRRSKKENREQPDHYSD